MTVAELLHSFGERLGIGPVETDENGLGQLVFDGRITVDIEVQGEGNGLRLLGVAGVLPPGDRAGLYRRLLAANLESDGPAFAIDENLGEVLLCRRVDAPVEVEAFEAVLAAFVDALETWQGRLADGEGKDDDAPASGAVPPMMLRG
jgi:hypothetical protein